nr:hypothetical protein CFP56_43922 [Quercus suber]
MSNRCPPPCADGLKSAVEEMECLRCFNGIVGSSMLEVFMTENSIDHVDLSYLARGPLDASSMTIMMNVSIVPCDRLNMTVVTTIDSTRACMAGPT